MESIKVLLITITSVVVLVLSTNYCSSKICRNSKHIACDNNGSFSFDCSFDAEVITITISLRNTILNKHNKFRHEIAGGEYSGFNSATRMATLKWNDELARLAVLNVQQCIMNHDACRNTKNFRYVGQNLAYSGWSGVDQDVHQVTASHIQMWFDEYKDTSMNHIKSFSNPKNGKVIGHFTQIIQDKATDIGCGIVRQELNGVSYQFTACNYSRTNIMSRPVYVSGKVASQCTLGRNPIHKNLCDVKEKIDSNSF